MQVVNSFIEDTFDFVHIGGNTTLPCASQRQESTGSEGR